MKKTIFLLTLFMSIALGSIAQDKYEKIESAKIAYLTKKVDLTPMQAEDFWPLYNEYSKKRRELHREKRHLKKNTETEQDDARLLEMMNRIEEINQMELNLDKSYRKRFLIILSPQQVMALYQGEREFRKIIRDKIKQRR